jgi:uncharacterized membrane protein YbhN (UPF0104 family)
MSVANFLAILRSSAARRWLKLAGQALMLAALYFVALRLVRSWSQVSTSLAQMHLVSLVGVALLSLIMLLLMSAGWTFALTALGASPGIWQGFLLYYWASIYRYLPGSIWHLPGRAYLCQKRGISLVTFTQSVFFELFFLLSTGGILAAWGLANFLHKPGLLGLSLVSGLLTGAVAIWPDALFKLSHLHAVVTPVKRGWLCLMLVTYLGVWFSYSSAVTLALQALAESHVPGFLSMLATNTAAWAAGFLSLAPVGLGVRELSLSMLLGTNLGAAAILASLAQRVTEISLEVCLWFISRLSIGEVDS